MQISNKRSHKNNGSSSSIIVVPRRFIRNRAEKNTGIRVRATLMILLILPEPQRSTVVPRERASAILKTGILVDRGCLFSSFAGQTHPFICT